MTDARKEALKIAGDCFAVRLRKLNREISAIYDTAFKESGVTIAQFNLLVSIEAWGQTTASQLVQTLSLEKSTASRNLARMQDKGWIRTLPAEDGRAQKLKLTESGSELLLCLTPKWQQAQGAAAKKLGPLTSSIENIEMV